MGLWILLGAVAFLCGSVPSALLVARRHGVDLRRVGSGNPGATNVYRTLGPRWGLLVLAADIGKGVLAVVLMRVAGAPPGWWLVAAAAAILGHIVSPFMGFRGGKGVATGGGAVLALAPGSGLVVLAVFAVTLAATRMVSAGSMLAALALPIVVHLRHEPVPGLVWVGGALALLVIVRHRGNLRRILRGEEKRFAMRGRGSGRPAGADAGAAGAPDGRAPGGGGR
ncbi:MAG: glycerol-3-phosphate 1-O-acyltransferase PlsY [Candidatus Eiseniibacteriota bacterium]|jgi:glycerol-3-phosphate acyltransferase PlsY